MKNGLLLINVGTPASPDTRAIRTFLREFLADKRVVDLSAFFRYLLLYGFILPFRPARTVKAYQTIWTDQGSPLLVFSEQLVIQLQQALGSDWKVALGMRYGKPSLKNALEELASCDALTILPLYPQYASASTGSALEAIFRLLSRKPWIPPVRFIHHFYDSPCFIKAMASRISASTMHYDHLLFSYHGLPEKHIQKTGCQRICENSCLVHTPLKNTCYRSHCFQTSRLLGEALHLQPNQYSTAFQSRLGRTPWIKPFTEEVLMDLRNKGIKHLAVACPAFVTDCLETLEEIGIRGKELWMEAGGESFTLVPALNDDPAWVEAICSWVRDGGRLDNTAQFN